MLLLLLLILRLAFEIRTLDLHPRVAKLNAVCAFLAQAGAEPQLPLEALHAPPLVQQALSKTPHLSEQ